MGNARSVFIHKVDGLISLLVHEYWKDQFHQARIVQNDLNSQGHVNYFKIIREKTNSFTQI